jgi:Tol biopolymer transport system component
MPRGLAGKILFMSDRDGSSRLYALDPANGRVALVTQAWPYSLALAAESRSSDGRFSLFVRNANTDLENKATGKPYVVQSPQVFVQDAEFKTVNQLTRGVSSSYDAVWSPRGTWSLGPPSRATTIYNKPTAARGGG